MHTLTDSTSPALGAERNGAGTPPAVLRITELHKQFKRAGGAVVQAIDDVSLEVAAGEVLVLLGPSGCGKTTLLRSIAGLEHPDRGRIEIKGRAVFDAAKNVRVPTEHRGLSMIFQSYALWPHMRAFENVAYPLRSRRTPKGDIAPRVERALEMVGIPELRNQYPAQMSGGQQQRVALARSVVANDDLILFDEPLSNVDARVREQLRFELVEMQAALGFAAVYVTHDQTEALSLAHRVAVMGSGKVQQLDTPRAIYAAPTSRYVANFIGTTNEIEGTVTEVVGDTVVVSTALGSLSGVAAERFSVGDAITLTCRPEHCSLSSERPDGANVLRAVVEASMFLGSHTEHLARVSENFEVKVWSSGLADHGHGEEIWLSMPPARLRGLRP